MLQVEQVLDRLTRLERRSKFVNRVGATLCLLGLAFAIAGQAAQEEQNKSGKKSIEADEIIIRDKSGIPRIRLGMEASAPCIKILRRDGKGAVELSEADLDSGLSWAAVRVTAKSGETASITGGSSNVDISLHSAISESRVERAINNPEVLNVGHEDGWLSFSLDKDRIQVNAWKDGQARSDWRADRESTQISLSDVTGKIRALWDVWDGAAAIAFLDGQTKPRLVLGREELKDVDTGAVQRRSEASVLMFGEDGKVIFSAPR